MVQDNLVYLGFKKKVNCKNWNGIFRKFTRLQKLISVHLAQGRTKYKKTIYCPTNQGKINILSIYESLKGWDKNITKKFKKWPKL